MPQADDAAAPTAGLRDDLHELAVLLRNADMRAIEVFERVQQTHAQRLQTLLLPLDEAMAALDFETALAHCQALMPGAWA